MTNSELLLRLQQLEDVEAIRRLKAEYCLACDDNYNPERLAPMFSEDAIWDGGVLGVAEGREGIREFFRAASRQVPFALHYVTNPIINVDGHSATGHWLLWEPMTFNTEKGKQGIWHSASYQDRYIKQDDQWLFQSVTIKIELLSPVGNNFGETPVLLP
jgi:hypothetical protein